MPPSRWLPVNWKFPVNSRRWLLLSFPQTPRQKNQTCGTCLYRCQFEKPKKECVFNPTGSPASISPPFSALTPPGSAAGSSELCVSFSPDKSVTAGGRGDRRPQPACFPKERVACHCGAPIRGLRKPHQPGEQSGRVRRDEPPGEAVRPSPGGPARRSPDARPGPAGQ